MPLAAGSKLGPYEIVAPLGVMGATATAPALPERRFTLSAPGGTPPSAASISPDGGAVLIQMAPQISPDGRYVAYTSMETGRMSTYVTQLPSGDGKWEIPANGTNLNPRWSGKSDRLSVMDERGRIVEFPVDRTRGFDIAPPVTPIPGDRSMAPAAIARLTARSF
jgi:hypothetical protein